MWIAVIERNLYVTREREILLLWEIYFAENETMDILC